MLLLSNSCDSQGNTDESSASKQNGELEMPEQVVDIETVDEKYDSLGLAEATFAGGCFWCVEEVFERVKGVEAAYSGYAGGSLKNPGYQRVASGATDHAESVRVYYDSTVVSYRQLLEAFFAGHDPTQLNRQGPDVGPQYRSAIFYHDERQKEQAEAFIRQLEESGAYDRPVVTKISSLNTFWKAEGYHQNYYDNHPNDRYIQQVSRPKVEKFMKRKPELLKEGFGS